MLAANFKRTKIVASLGPATDNLSSITAVIKAGANCVRLNLSHGTHQEHADRVKLVREIAKEIGKPVPVLMDLQGPKIRIGELPEGGIRLAKGQEIQLSLEGNYAENGVIPMQYDFTSKAKVGEEMFLYDGQLQATIQRIENGTIWATVKTGGTLTSRKGINLPDTDFAGDIFTEKDEEDLVFAVNAGADLIGLSFVQSANDVANLRRRLKNLRSEAGIIAKIETKLAVTNLEAIMAAADAVMVARGDLAVELPAETVPVVQKKIVELGQQLNKPVIVATQMMQSMVNAPRPTRAEVSDVATAVMQGADAVMLSEETTIGKFPSQAVAMMKKVILHTQTFSPPPTRQPNPGEDSQQNAISAAAVVLAKQINAKAIIAETVSGQTALNIASFRPSVPVIIVTNRRSTYLQQALVWGGRPYLRKSPKSASSEVMDLLKQDHNVKNGDHIVVVSGHQAGVAGGTDRLQIYVIK